MSKVKVLNTEIAVIDATNFKNIVKGFLDGKDPRTISTRLRKTSDGQEYGAGVKQIGKVNTEFLLRAQKDKEFRDTLDGFDINIADGKGVLWAAKYLSLPLRAKKFSIFNFQFLIIIEAIWQMKYTGASLIFYPKYCKDPIPENIPGVDALYIMLESAVEKDLPVYFLGAADSVNEKAVERIKEKYPKLKVAGRRGGFWDDENEIIKDINESGAKLLVVALGSPKQEFWIRDNIDKLKTVRVAVGEGGSLDFVAGTSRRAPRWMQRAGVEWLWRLFANRSRSATGSRAKRVWQAVPVFIYEVVKWKIKES